jgi:cytochrome c peroxidase
VELTAPYLHAGTAATLREVVEFKNRGESDHPKVTSNQLDPLVRPLGLTTEEVSRLVQFLAAYTDRITTEGPLFQAPERVPSGLEIPK